MRESSFENSNVPNRSLSEAPTLPPIAKNTSPRKFLRETNGHLAKLADSYREFSSPNKYVADDPFQRKSNETLQESANHAFRASLQKRNLNKNLARYPEEKDDLLADDTVNTFRAMQRQRTGIKKDSKAWDEMQQRGIEQDGVLAKHARLAEFDMRNFADEDASEKAFFTASNRERNIPDDPSEAEGALSTRLQLQSFHRQREEQTAMRENRSIEKSRFSEDGDRRAALKQALDAYSKEYPDSGFRSFEQQPTESDRRTQSFKEKNAQIANGILNGPKSAARLASEQRAADAQKRREEKRFEDALRAHEKKLQREEYIRPGVERRAAAQKLVAERNAAAAKRIEDLRSAAYARPKPTRAVNQDGAHVSFGEEYVDLPEEDWDNIDTGRPPHQAPEVLGKEEVTRLINRGDFANDRLQARNTPGLSENKNTTLRSNHLFGEPKNPLQLEDFLEEDRNAPSSDARSYANRFGYPGASKWNTPNEQPRRAPLQLEAQNPVEFTHAPQPIPEEDGPAVTYRAEKKKNLGLTLGDVEDLEAWKDLSDPNTSGDRFHSGKELARAARGFAKEYNRPDVAQRVAELERAYASASQRPAESTTESTPSKATVAAPPELPSSKDRRTSSFVSPAAAEMLDAMNANFGDELSARRKVAEQKAPSTKEDNLRNEGTLPSDTEQMREDIENALRRDREQLVTRPERAKQTQETSVIVDSKILQEGRRAELLEQITIDDRFASEKRTQLRTLQDQLAAIEDGIDIPDESGKYFRHKPGFRDLYGTDIQEIQNGSKKIGLFGLAKNLWNRTMGDSSKSAQAMIAQFNTMKAKADEISDELGVAEGRIAENRQEVAEIERRAAETEETRKQDERHRAMGRRMSSAKNPSPSRAAGFIDTNNKNLLEEERNDHENRVASLAQFLLDHGKRAKQDEALEAARLMMTHMNDEELYNYKEDARKESAEHNAQAAMAARTKSLPRDLNTRFSVPSSSNKERRYGSLNVTANRADSSEVKAAEAPFRGPEVAIEEKRTLELTPEEKNLVGDLLGEELPGYIKAFFKNQPGVFEEAIKSTIQFTELEGWGKGFGSYFWRLNRMPTSDAKAYIADGIRRLSLNPTSSFGVLKKNGALDQCITNVQHLYEGIRGSGFDYIQGNEDLLLPPYKEGAIEKIELFAKKYEKAA